MIFLLWQFCYSTLAAPTPNATYSDVLARTKMLPLASAAYSKWPQDCLTNRFTNAVLKRRLDVECDPVKVDTCSGYSAVLNDDKAIVLGFRGTSGFLQLLEEADQSVLMRKSPWIAGGKVSKYFNTAFMDLWNAGIRDDFNALISQYPSYRIWITGHSLGGAVASLAASYIIAANLTSSGRVQLVTFGQPRTGDNDFAHAHDKQVGLRY
uniref:Lipase_3 domain-containing protein n=1 Tax=Angiostrongylus cantonensis TaxID=6313 RepID=A0A0K0D5M1_ANGCA